jgi:LysM repeat protein
MSMKSVGIIAFLSTLLLLSGCQTPQQQQQETQRKMWEDSLSRRVVDIENRIFDLEQNLAVQKRQLNNLDQQMTEIQNASVSATGRQASEVEILRKEVAAAQVATEKKINIILDEVARENKRILQSISSARGGASYSQGYEHVVKSGETISTIAREYKVTTDAIVAANQLTDPNNIRVGQVLFIPQ